MSLSLEDLKGEMRENHMRIEEVLSGMDNVMTKLERKIRRQDERINTLEGQLASIVEALTDDAVQYEAKTEPRNLSEGRN